MTTLVHQPLLTTLEQEIEFTRSTRLHIAALCPYLYMHNSPAGTFTLELLRDAEVVFSQDFDCDDIKESLSTTDNYAHVFYPVEPLNPVQIESGLYTIKLSATGYVPTWDSFLGWIQQFENVQNAMDYDPASVEENSLAIRYKEYKEGIR